ncbi:hypothetical protein PISMIDRAFT_10103 [Pisolithus microcarpus 441]|uniref:Unplaced genomic scaffold scaffold_30, whole genome shotgun sequence n=1 Tax=Pisolithus microcarpus 441 TaxID=765257 RepID=A0A0C9ZQW1_9AGAM|nr:hypothetical protein PISMIDRAFT_10103 [Pisolithus microcarpus 441]
MSTSKATTSRQPVYVPPDAIHKEIPKRWAKNMEALAAVMREIPDEVAEEDVAQEWMERFEEVSAQIKELHKFTANMSAEVPEYPEDTKEAIGSGFLMLVALRNWFPRDAMKPRPKPAPGAAARPKVGGKVRRSQCQLEKAAMTDEGPKDTSHAAELVAIGVAVASSREAPAVEQEQAAVVDNVMQGLRSGVIGATQASQGTEEPCERCVKRGVQCIWEGGVACEACHIGKKKCDKAGKPGRKCKNPNVPPASSASTSKRVRMTPVPPPSSSAPPKVTLRGRPRVVSRAVPAAEAAPSLPMPQDIPSASVLTLPSILLFLPSSHPTTPTPTPNPQDPTPPPSPVDHDTVDISVAFVPVPSRILDEGNVGTDDTPADVEEIDLTMPRASPLPEEDIPRARKGKRRADSSERSPFEELDARITAIEESIKWGEETLLDLYSQMAQVTADMGQDTSELWVGQGVVFESIDGGIVEAH